LISNTYHEFAQPGPMLRHIREALKPAGRLVIVENYSRKNGRQPRPVQVNDHEISPDLLEPEVVKEGFTIVSRVDPVLIASGGEGDQTKYLIVATKSATPH